MGIIEPKRVSEYSIIYSKYSNQSMVEWSFCYRFLTVHTVSHESKTIAYKGNILYQSLFSSPYWNFYRKAAVYINHKRFVESQLLFHNIVFGFSFNLRLCLSMF